MGVPMIRAILFAFILMLSSVAANAGQLFPPPGIDPNSDCPEGQMLTWKGSGEVHCANVSPNVSTDLCPANSVLIGITKGEAICKLYDLDMQCPDNEYMQGIADGAPVCSPITTPKPPEPVKKGSYTQWCGPGNRNCNGCGGRCVTPNPYTGTCSCPAGTTPVNSGCQINPGCASQDGGCNFRATFICQ